MRTIGLLGGVSWESTSSYYKIINEEVRRRLGGLHSARLVMYSVDFSPLSHLQHEGDWSGVARELANAATQLSNAGAECLVICSNTMHKVADEVREGIRMPLLHIADATAARLLTRGVPRVGLLGTRFTMEQEFYRKRLTERGIDVIIPNESDREAVHRIIYDELCRGEARDESREHYRRIMQRMADAGADGVILGCTEIGMLVNDSDSVVPLFDTTRIHAEAAVDFALNESH